MWVWVLGHYRWEAHAQPGWFSFARFRAAFARSLQGVMPLRWVLVGVYIIGAGFVILLFGGRVGTEIFPTVDAGQFQLRLDAPDGTRIDLTEEIAKQAVAAIHDTASNHP